AFLFRYYPRPGTFAFRHQADDVPEASKGDRLTRMIALQEEISAERYARWIGREVLVRVEGPSRRSRAAIKGKADDGKAVLLPADGAIEGDFRVVRVARASSHTLFAEGVALAGDESDLDANGGGDAGPEDTGAVSPGPGDPLVV
ncbi:MAG: TRAM domain-containing protein, partial [Candidatus Eisenbacteria bacterium]|nr:TRAM domain-containing protein [Candidatus Eisenbacteria bacterium]